MQNIVNLWLIFDTINRKWKGKFSGETKIQKDLKIIFIAKEIWSLRSTDVNVKSLNSLGETLVSPKPTYFKLQLNAIG